MPITVPYVELHEGSYEEVEPGVVKAQKKYLIAWTDRWQFARDVAGTAQKVGSGLGTILRVVPLQYAPNKNLYANGLSMESTGRSSCDGAGNSIYTHCVCTVSFSTPVWDYDSGTDNPGQYDKPYKTLSISMSADIMTLPSRPWRFDTLSGGQIVPFTTDPGLVYPKAEITVVSHQLPDIPLDIVFGLVGKLNDATFYGCAVGTVLFIGANQNRQRSAYGDKAWEAEYRFIYRPVDWNKYFSPAPGVGFDFVKDRSTSARPYAYGDFSTLP